MTRNDDLMTLILLRDIGLPRYLAVGLAAERRARAAAGKTTSLLELALNFGYISRAQATTASALYKRLAYRPGVHKPLGYLLLEAGLVTGKQLADALATKRESGKFLGQVLVEQGVLAPTMLTMFLTTQRATRQAAARAAA